ncbi:hypothetical protein NIES4072_03480 [Nostoc commune NIES-4072]|uniref:Uncharacterized protein n=1 Tax=Nostoc commune NIES-4072 TaxID=2005467 RepID=A0A2R5FE42_NOSCO|nr:hypothetical protein [Nostoc commune]BBD65973.1 hypothetical protein NIES4070_23340 [Nostoc commune HK-02]GBG16702.1 hypothetical protein NIES4072_03480 [Nostoc commune NIES-4072]
MDNIEAMPTAVNYALLEKALTAFEAAKKLLTIAQVALSPENQSRDTRETAATLDRFAYYHPGPQEPQTDAKFLKLLNSGIFHLLPNSAYHRQMNNFQNRLSADVSELYPFPSLSEAKGAFSPSLSLQLLGNRIITSASGRRLKLVLATLFFGELTISYQLCQLI